MEYDTQFTRFRLPPLTLQPIVENAVKHGMDPYAGPLHVAVRSYRLDSSSVIVVEDNGSGFDTAKINESHNALMNIRKRLEMMCGGKMEIKSRDAGGTIVKSDDTGSGDTGMNNPDIISAAAIFLYVITAIPSKETAIRTNYWTGGYMVIPFH